MSFAVSIMVLIIRQGGESLKEQPGPSHSNSSEHGDLRSLPEMLLKPNTGYRE